MPSRNEMWMADRLERAKPKVLAMLRERGPMSIFEFAHLGRQAIRAMEKTGEVRYNTATEKWEIV